MNFIRAIAILSRVIFFKYKNKSYLILTVLILHQHSLGCCTRCDKEIGFLKKMAFLHFKKVFTIPIKYKHKGKT